jgi:hypothetical protein
MERRSFFKMLGIGVAAAIALLVLDKIASKIEQGYRTYIAGENANLSTSVSDEEKAYYHAKHKELPGWVSYRFHMTTSLPPNTAKRIRFIDAVKS